MSWETELVEMVRVLINDLDSSAYTYTDDRIQRIIIIGANQVLQDVEFLTTYTVDITDADILPDPTDSDPKDYAFLNLIALKTACLILGGETKQYSLSGGGSITITDAGSTISTGNMFKNIQDVAKDICSQYQLAKMNYNINYSTDGYTAITTPVTVVGSNCCDRSNYRGIY